MFRNEHVNYLIAYPFDFGNEELLSYYISFLRCVKIALFQFFVFFFFYLDHSVYHFFIWFCNCFWTEKSDKWETEQGYNFSPC